LFISRARSSSIKEIYFTNKAKPGFSKVAGGSYSFIRKKILSVKPG